MKNKKTSGPDFLAIGPPKTATTWLYNALIQHPDVKFPPMKEVGYLWEKKFLGQRNYMSLFFCKHWFYKARRKYILYSFYQHVKNLLIF